MGAGKEARKLTEGEGMLNVKSRVVHIETVDDPVCLVYTDN